MKYFDQKLNRRILKELEKERDMNINYQPILVDQDNSDSPLSISSSSEYSEIELNIKKNLSRRSVTNFNENELMWRSSLSGKDYYLMIRGNWAWAMKRIHDIS